MSRRPILVLVLSLIAGAALLPLEASARRGGGRARTQFPLTPTAAAAGLALKGKARIEVRPDRGREKVTVEVESRAAAEGARLDAYAINPANQPDPVFLGTLVLRPNPRRPGEVEDQIELKNWEGAPLPVSLSPVASITEFRVTPAGDPGTILLQGRTPGQAGGGGGGNGGPGPGTGDELRRRVTFTPTAAGAAVRARGYTEIRARFDRGREEFKVQVESAGLADGTVLEVRFSHSANGGPFSAGTVVVQAGRAELETQSHEPPFLPEGASPVSGITSVTVVDQQSGEVLLTAAL